MMTARELFDQGHLDEAIAAQNEVVKANPTDLDARHALSVYLCFAGNLDRAFLQLNTMGQQDPELAMASNVYRSLLIADLQRRKAYQEDAKPLLPPDCPPHVEERLRALLARRAGDEGAARAALERAAESEGNHPGKLNGESFLGIRDYDDLLGSVLEVYAGETYLWMPLEQIRTLKINPPKHLLDLLFIPAELEDINGAEASVHLPAVYEGSYLSNEGQLRIGQGTDWVEAPGIGCCGVGQKLLFSATESETRETGLLEIRSLEFEPVASDESAIG
jgi:type VI secretion system protein ImpE